MPQSKEKQHIGLDGIPRPKEAEDMISMGISSLFSEPNGQEVLRYLKSITIELVGGPDISESHLRHLEGQRYIIGLIERHIRRGHKVKSDGTASN